jgi:hypothetical protein
MHADHRRLYGPTTGVGADFETKWQNYFEAKS